MMMDGMGMMIFMFLFGLLLIVLFVVIVVAIVKWLWDSNVPLSVNDRENTLEILRKRYAKGEIGERSSKQSAEISKSDPQV